MAITLRNVKGSELTFEELDGNFTDLNGRVTTLEGSTGLSNVVEDISPELGGDLVTGTNRLKFSSAGGSMLDFTVTQYSVANNTVLSSVGSINLFLDSASADSSGDTAFRIFDTTNPDGAVTETNNIFKIADTGDISVKGNILVSGTNQIQLGAAQDLSIFHNGGHSIVRETGTGSLYLQSDNNVILSTNSGTKKMVKGVGSGEVVLYHNDIQKLNTSTSGVTVVDELHTEGATPHLTLKRTDNANVPTIRFKGSGGTIGASIDFDGTAGTSNELAFQTYDGATIAERFRVTYTGAKVTGNLQVGVLDTDATITTQGTGDLTLSTNSGTNSGTIILRDGVNGDIILETDGTGDVLLKGNRVGIGSVNQPDTTLHLKDTNSVITLQRTADANQPGLSFQQSGGNVRATLRMDGTSGTANEVFITTDNQDGQGLVERFRAGHTGVTITGTLNTHTIPAGTGTLALTSDIPAAYTNASVDTHLNQSNPQSGYVLSWNGSDYAWVAQSGGGGGIALTDLSVGAEGTASGDGAIAYDNSTGIFTYTPPVIPADLGDLTDTGNLLSSNIISQGNTNVTASDSGSDGNISFQTEGTGRWSFTSAGHLLPASDAAYDIGSASNKVRHFFLSDNSLKFGAAELPLTVTASRLHFNSEKLMTSLVDDTSPELGSDLDCLGKNITSVGDLTSSTINTSNIRNSGNPIGMEITTSASQINIGTASFTGSSVNLGSQALSTTVNVSGVSEFGAPAIFNRGVHERFYTINAATGVVDHNLWTGHVFLHTSPAANWTANFTNLDLAQEDSTNIAIVVNQGNTGYIPNAVQIGGAAQTIIWNGNSTPSATDNGTDVFSFTILNDGGTYIVLGQMVSFGGV